MRLILCLLVVALPAQAERLDPSDLVYEGVIGAPKTATREPSFGRGPLGLEYDPTCAGREDPSPADGYPGCLAATSHKKSDMVAMFDIPAPEKVEKGRYEAVPKGSFVVDFFKCTIRPDGSDIQTELDARPVIGFAPVGTIGTTWRRPTTTHIAGSTSIPRRSTPRGPMAGARRAISGFTPNVCPGMWEPFPESGPTPTWRPMDRPTVLVGCSVWEVDALPVPAGPRSMPSRVSALRTHRPGH
jgi:hypothetical protein